MKIRNVRPAARAINLTIAVVCITVTGATKCLFAAEADILSILLTNDDGYDAPGITTLRETLVAAGHEVTVVAPLVNQSGSGMSVTIQGTLDYKEQSNRVWSVDGTPADSVLVALLHIIEGDAPDIVVSGANFGPNIGYASSSGTVGAATMASYLGLPAISISVGIVPSERDAEPVPFPSTLRAFTAAAELATKIIGDLKENRSGNSDLLPERIILNVNYPAVDADEIKGVRVLPATWNAGVSIDYEETGQSGQLRIGLQLLEPGETGADDADWQWFARGYVTISILDGNTDAGQSQRDVISQRLLLTKQP